MAKEPYKTYVRWADPNTGEVISLEGDESDDAKAVGIWAKADGSQEVVPAPTPDVPVSEVDEQVDPEAEADRIIGVMATTDEAGQLAILDELGVTFSDLDAAQTAGGGWQPYKAAIVKTLSKGKKQAAITPAAAVIESGQPPPSGDGQKEALAAELQSYYSGEHGSLSDLANQRRIKEITAELDKLEPPVQ